MGTVTATVRELFESERTPSKVSTLLRGCVGRSGVSKALKHLKETGSALPKVGSTPGRRVVAPKLIENAEEKVGRNPRRSVGKLASAAGVSCEAMQNVLKSDLGLSLAEKQKLNCCLGLQESRDGRGLGFFWKGLEMARNLQFYGLMRGCSLSGPCTVIRVAGFTQ